MRSEGNRCVTHVKQGSLSPDRPVRQGTQLGGLWLALRTLIKLVSKLYAISQKNVVSGGIFFPAALFCVPDEVLDRLYTLSPYLKKHAFSLYSFKVTKNAQNQAFDAPNFRHCEQICHFQYALSSKFCSKRHIIYSKWYNMLLLAFARKTTAGSTEIANQSSDRKTKQPRLANKYYSSCWSASSSTAFTLPVCPETVSSFFPRKLSPRSLNTVASSKMRSSAHRSVR